MISRLYYINFGIAAATAVVAASNKEYAIVGLSLLNAIVSWGLASVFAEAERNIK